VAALVGASLALGVWIAASAETRDAQRARPLRLEPDSEGHLERVLIHFTPSAADDLVTTYRDVVGALADDTEVLVAVETTRHFEQLRTALGEIGRDRRRRSLRPIVVGRPITAWSRDRFATARRGAHPRLLVPPQRISPLAPRANDWVVPWTVSAELGGAVESLETTFDFDGGDLIADESRVYATALVLDRNRDRPAGRRETLREELRRTTGLDVVLIGAAATEVPDHHIGMFLTPLGDDRVLVGDPSLAAGMVSGGEVQIPHPPPQEIPAPAA